MAGFHTEGCAKAADHSKRCSCGACEEAGCFSPVVRLPPLTQDQVDGKAPHPQIVVKRPSTSDPNLLVPEQVDHPAHYGGKDNPYEAIKVIEAWQLNFCLGNCVKYINRAGKKDRLKLIEDLKKARWYLDREIERLIAGS